MSKSHIRIKNEFFRTPEYIEFFRKRKADVYYFLLSAVIRESDEVKNFSHGANYIYQKHFLQGELVSRYSQKKVAEYLKTSQSRISKYLKDLEKDGFIRIIERSIPNLKRTILYYQFGTWKGVYGKGTYQEAIWLDEYFSKKYHDSKKAKIQENEDNATVNLMAPYAEFDEFIFWLEKFGSVGEVKKDHMKTLWEMNKETIESVI